MTATTTKHDYHELVAGARNADKKAIAGADLCHNCGAPIAGRFCSQCGQETAIEPPSAAQFFKVLIRRYAARDGLLWQTLRRLFFAPGALTIEYLAGRRARYVRPLQLYFGVSVIVFATVQIFSLDAGFRFYGEHGFRLLRSSPISIDESAVQSIRLTPVQVVLRFVDTDGVRRFKAMQAQDRFAFLHARRAQYVSYLVLFLVPLFALILSLCYRDRRQPYSTHLVFGLHTHSFFLLMLLVEAILTGVAANLVSLSVVAYFLAALRRVYAGTWLEALSRGTLAVMLYFAALFGANALLVFALLEF